jgi:hypothetical protein
MCRKAGRRCPSHTDEQAIEERNETRREQYASKVLRDKTAEFLSESSVKFVRGDEVKNAYFQGKEDFDLEKFEAIKDPAHVDTIAEVLPHYFWSKPEEGGLWTSPGVNEDGKVKTAWTDWSVENSFNVNKNPVTPIRVRKQAVIVVIDNEEDLDALCKAYPNKTGFSFEAMANAGIDGLRLSEAGHRASKNYRAQGRMQNFSIWDLDSTVWLNKENLSAGKPVEQGGYPDRIDDDRNDSPWDDHEQEEETESWEDLMAQLEVSSQQEVPFDEKEAAAARLRMKLIGD